MRWARRSIVVEIVFVRNSPSPSLSLLLFPSSSSRPASHFLSFTPVPSCPSPSTSTVGSSRYSIPVARQRFGGTIPPCQTRLGSILPNERRERALLSLALWKLERGIARARVSAWFLTLVDLFWFPSNGETYLSS